MGQKNPLSIKVVCVYLLSLIVLNAVTYAQMKSNAFLILIGVNAIIIYGLLFKQVWSWFVLMAYALMSLLNPFPLDFAPGSLVMAVQAFQADNMRIAGILVYASIFSLALLMYAFYGWRTLHRVTEKVDNNWAYVIGFIFLWNVSGIMKVFFDEAFTTDIIYYSIAFVALIAVWEWFERKQTQEVIAMEEKKEKKQVQTVKKGAVKKTVETKKTVKKKTVKKASKGKKK